MKITGKILLGGSAIVFVVGILILLFPYFATIIIFADVGYEKGGQILFINKENPDIMILKQSYFSGAWDDATTTRIIKKNIHESAVESVDTSKIDTRQWVPVKVHFTVWNSHDRGVSLGPERFKEFFTELNKTGQLTFKLKNVKQFKELLLPVNELDEITNHWNNYSDNTFSEKFKAYVFYKYDALVLNTVANDFSNINEIVLMKKDTGYGYEFHLYSTFITENKFSVTKEYKSFEVDAAGKPMNETMDTVIEINNFEITDDGEIIRTTEGLFGKIVVNH